MTDHTPIQRAPLARLEGAALNIDDAHGVVAFDPHTGALAAGRTTLRLWRTLSGTPEIFESGEYVYIEQIGFRPNDPHPIVKFNSEIARLDMAKGEQTPLITAEKRINSFDVSRDGALLARAGRDKVPSIHDAVTGELIRTLGKHRADIYGVALDPAGERLATASGKVARIWNVDGSGKAVQLKGMKNPLGYVRFSGDGRRLLGMSFKYELCVWDIASKALLWEKRSCWGRASFTPDDAAVFTCRCERLTESDEDPAEWILIKLDAETGDTLARWPIGESALKTAMSPDGRTMATTVLYHKALGLWDLEDGTDLVDSVGHKSTVHSVAVTPGGESVVSIAKDGQVIEWSLNDYSMLRSARGTRTSGLTCTSFSKDGARMVAGESCRVSMRDASSWEELWGASIDLNTAAEIVWLKNDTLLMVLCEPRYKSWNRVYFLDAATGELVARHDKVPFTLCKARAASDGTSVLAVGSKGVLTFELDDCQIIQRVDFPNKSGGFCDLSPDGTRALLGVGGPGTRLFLYDTKTGRRLQKIDSTEEFRARFIDGGALIWTSSVEGDWAVFNAANGDLVAEAETGVHTDKAFGLGDSGLLATATNMGPIALWDVSGFQAPKNAAQEGVKDTNAQLGGLRELVYQTPDKAAWDAICALLDDWDGVLDIALEYAETHLAGWPDTVRLMPSHWMADMLAGRDQPRALLARTLHQDDAYDTAASVLVDHPAISALTSLAFSGKNFSNKGAAALAKSPHLGRLRYLSLWGNTVRVKGARALAKAPFLGGLETLKIRSPIGGSGAAAIVSSPELSNLTELHLPHCKLGEPAFVNAFIAAEHLAGLRKLDLSYNTRLDLRCIGEARHLTSLESLELRCFQVRVANVSSLLRAEHLRGLKDLDLGSLYLNESEARLLAEAPFAASLVSIDIDLARGISAATIERLRVAFPNLDKTGRRRLEYRLDR